MFIIYINDIFFALKGIRKFPDNTTPYLKDSNLKSVVETLEHNSELAVTWFEMNYIKLNSDKCHLLISRNKNDLMWAKLNRHIVWESNDVKVLGITLDNNQNLINMCLIFAQRLSEN